MAGYDNTDGDRLRPDGSVSALPASFYGTYDEASHLSAARRRLRALHDYDGDGTNWRVHA